MGRAPCCDKANVKRGPWSPEEDMALKNYLERHGTGGNWIALPRKAGLKRCGKSCRLRWLNYLRPDIKHGGFTEEEDNIICSLYNSIGSRWSVIASRLPGRTDNDVKNYWNTKLKKKFVARTNTLTSNNITSNNNIHLISTPSPAASLTKPESFDDGFSTCLNTGFTPLPLSNEAGFGQNLNSSTCTPVADPIHFSLPRLSDSSEFDTSMNNSYSVSSSQEVSGLSASPSLAMDNSYVSWPSNGGGVDDGFFTDFGYGFSFDFGNGFGIQEKTSEIAPYLANSSHNNLFTNGPHSKPEKLYHGVTF